jgi:hypothetical protein
VSTHGPAPPTPLPVISLAHCSGVGANRVSAMPNGRDARAQQVGIGLASGCFDGVGQEIEADI